MMKLFVLAAFVALASAQLNLVVTNGAVVFQANVTTSSTSTNFANALPFSSGSEILRGFCAIPGAGNSSQPYLAISNLGNFYQISGNGQNATLLFNVNCTGRTNSALSMDINPVTGVVAIMTISPPTNGSAVVSNFFYVNVTSQVCTPQTLVNYSADTTAVKALGLSYYFNTANNSTTLYLLSVNASSNGINLFVVPPAGGSLGPAVGATGLSTTSGTGALTTNYAATNQAVLVAYNASGNGDSTVATVNLATGAATTAGSLSSAFVPFGFAILGNPFPVTPNIVINGGSAATTTNAAATTTSSTSTTSTYTTSTYTTSTSPSATSSVSSSTNGGSTTVTATGTATATTPTGTITVTATGTTTGDARSIGASFAVLALGVMMVMA